MPCLQTFRSAIARFVDTASKPCWANDPDDEEDDEADEQRECKTRAPIHTAIAAAQLNLNFVAAPCTLIVRVVLCGGISCRRKTSMMH